MEPKPLFGGLGLYRDRGKYLHRLEQFDKAIAAYNEAFQLQPEDNTTLLGRALACADAMKTNQSYADAEAALKIQPHNIYAKSVQARAMYTMTNFESSTVMNFRGLRIRRQPPYFKEGIDQGIATIEDCIGTKAGPVMTDMLPIIQDQELLHKEVPSEIPPHCCKHVSRIPKLSAEKKMTRLELRKTNLLARELAMKYLGPMANDKFFLQKLVDDNRIYSANKTGSNEIHDTVVEALRSLSERQEMLRTQRPFYSVKFSEKAKSKYQTKLMAQRLENVRTVGTANARRFIIKIKKFLEDQRVMDVMRIAQSMQTFLNSKTPHTLPDLDLFTTQLYTLVGEAYFIQQRLSYRLSEASNRRRIAFLMGLPVGRPKSFDSVMAKYPYKFVDISQMIENVEKSLKICENPQQRCYLLYEMSQLLNKQKNYTLAKFYAKRCQYQAQEINNHYWWMNGLFSLMSGDMQQGNQNDIRVAVEQAYEYSKQIMSPQLLQAFLAKCLQMAMEAVPPDEFKLIKQREQQVLKVLDDKTKVDARVLFKRIWNVPAGRRFYVLPRKAEYNEPVRRKYKESRLTVVQGPDLKLPRPPKSKVLGYQHFEY